MRGLTPQRRCVTFSLIPQLDATASRHYTDLISEECVARGTMTPEENDLLCRVEGNAPMGQIMRRHWIAACLLAEVAVDVLSRRVGEVVKLLGREDALVAGVGRGLGETSVVDVVGAAPRRACP